MKLLPSPDWQTTIHRFLPRGALFFIWLGCLLILLGWPNPLQAAPNAAPLAQVGCSASMDVSNTAELNNAIGCYNSQTTAGLYAINFTTAITLDTPSTVISNTNPGVALQIIGNIRALSGANTYRGLEISANTQVMIDRLMIRNGKADTNGGGILNHGKLTIFASAVVTNSATSDGGGIYNTGTLTMSFGTFSGNSAPNGNGGGVYNTGTGPVLMVGTTLNGNLAQFGGGIYNTGTGTMTVRGITFSGNSATNGGGGIYNAGTGTVSMEVSTLSGNSAQLGGGTYNTGSGTLTVSGSTLSGNSASHSGGSIYNVGMLTVHSSRLSGNSALVDGGSIYNEGTLTVSNGTLSDNTATRSGGSIRNEGILTVRASSLLSNTAQLAGGGIYHSDTGTLTVSNSTLSNNKVTGNTSDGGGIYSSGPLTVTNSTLSGNESNDSGGGIYNNSVLTLRNTIIANSPKGGDCVNNTGTITGQTHNLIEDGANACGIADGANNSIISQDPALAPLDYNNPMAFGTQIHALLATSPAIDQGDAATCAAPPINNLDQNEGMRPQGAACDIGAVEYTPPVCTFPATVNTTAELNNAISCYNSQTTAGVYTITFNADITLNAASTVINNPTPGVALQINGNGEALHGANTYRGLEISANTQVTIDNLIIVDGKADTGGGGILNRGSLTVISSLLANNSAPNGDGGGIYNTGTGTLTMTLNSLSGNSALFRGGGIYNEGRLTMERGFFSVNSAESGGGLMNNRAVTVNGSTFGANTAKHGGGLYNNVDSTLTISRSEVFTNSVDNDGGGIYNAGRLTVSQSTLRGNSALGGLYDGGGIYNFGELTVSNSTLSGNRSGDNGGGLYNAGNGVLTVTNSTLSDNEAIDGAGGGLYLSGALTLKNTIIANSPSGGDCVNVGGTITQTHNLIEDSANACGIANGANSSLIGQDPALAPLADNGFDLLKTHDLLFFSPAIDQGDAATCAAPPINNRDQNGLTRPLGDTCDIGAVEYILSSADCTFPVMVSTTTELNHAIGCYNLQSIAGVYTITFSADITLDTASRTINNPTSGVALQINGNNKVLRGANTYRGLAIAHNTHVAIAGLTIREGKTDTDGGGIYNAGALTMTSSTLGHNSALFSGGGIYNEGTLLVQGSFEGNSAESGGGLMNNGAVTVNGSTFYTNTAKNGGGLYNNIDSTLTISSSAVLTNSASTGGGIDNVGALTVTNSTLSGNSAANFGGGLMNSSTGTLMMSNSTFSSNSVTSGSGGGISNFGMLMMSNSTFSGNSARGSGFVVGGGIYNEGALTVSGSTLRGNSALLRGGGILNSGALTVSNSTLSGNEAIDSVGGGIFSDGALRVTNSTLSDNAAALGDSAGGGLYFTGTLTLKNTIIANSPSGGDCVKIGGAITQTHNLIEDSASACGLANGANSSLIGQDPALAPLALNGGSSTETHALLAISPAIDQGDAATCAAAPINNRDQNGGIRPQGVACDIGAVEVTPPTKESLNVSKTGAGTGQVTSSPAGIDCGTTCSASFVQNSVVTLTATPDTGSTFGGWSGACTGTGVCQVTLDAAKNVVATFSTQATSQVSQLFLPLVRR